MYSNTKFGHAQILRGENGFPGLIRNCFGIGSNSPTPHRTEHVGDSFGNRVEDNVAMDANLSLIHI